VHDRRNGHREEYARVAPPVLERHTADKLYSLTLAHAVELGTCVLAGMDSAVVPTSFYARLAADLRTLAVTVLTDVHGPALDALIGAGGVDLVKVSEDDLRDDGLIQGGEQSRGLIAAIEQLADRGEFDLLVTRGPDRPTVARVDGVWFQVVTPRLAAVDWRGAGDAMTGALAVGRRRKLTAVPLLRLSAAAGAASVTRRGLASLDAVLVESIASRITVRQVAGPQEAVAG
jgi:1-phosphofructokinase